MMDFIKNNSSLLMIYQPDFRHEEVRKKLDEDELNLKRVFFLGKKDESNELEISEDEFCFKIGKLVDGYYLLNKEILSTDNQFYISANIKINQKMFVAYQNISILRKIDALVECDIYITDEIDNISGHIPYEEYKALINTFPNTTEITKYVNARLTQSITNYVDGLGDIVANYEKYLNKRSEFLHVKQIPELQAIRLELFERAYHTLKEMLENAEAYNERNWQLAISNIICILYPKYILAKREISIGSDGRHNKKPDFLLVDSSGFIDILEIKKPNKQRLLTTTQYRNNYVADRDLSGAIVQIEKYIYSLNHIGTKIEEDLQKRFSGELPDNVLIRVTNPQGMLLMGRSNNLSRDQLFDLEIIKRQHKNIVDIMTYDDLLERLKNIIDQLSID